MSHIANTEQIVTTASSAGFSFSSMLHASDLVGSCVIILLLLSSVWSWTLIITKLLTIAKLRKHMLKFENIFWSGQILDDLYERVKSRIDNPLAAVFVAAMNECKKSKNTAKKSDILLLGYKERIMQSMLLAKNREMDVLEQKIGFLATVGSSATFVGLFGTVWGIMHSFQSIAFAKNTSLAVVAPGIAEALFATSVGLFAAIPAMVFYNYICSKIDDVGVKMDDFIGELSSLLSRAIDEEKM